MDFQVPSSDNFVCSQNLTSGNVLRRSLDSVDSTIIIQHFETLLRINPTVGHIAIT